jgi:ATP-dependent protease HslVU (ClpYQ) ATPase subunit
MADSVSEKSLADVPDPSTENVEKDLQTILEGQHVPVNHITVGLDKIGIIIIRFNNTKGNLHQIA